MSCSTAPKLYEKFPHPLSARGGGRRAHCGTEPPCWARPTTNGTGAVVIEAAIDGEAVPYAFLLKMLFTALTLGAGFRGGEIVPIFFTRGDVRLCSCAAAGSAAAAGRGAGYGSAVLRLHQQPAGVHLPGD